MEIERKWFIPENTTLSFFALVGESSGYSLQQLYASHTPEVRLARARNWDGTTRYNRITFKGEGDLSRFEEMVDCSEELINHFLTTTPLRNIIFKDYRKFPIIQGEKTYDLEVSKIDGKFSYAEVEFSSEEEARAFLVPTNWVEATYFPCFKMKAYAENKKRYLRRRAALLLWDSYKKKLNGFFQKVGFGA